MATAYPVATSRASATKRQVRLIRCGAPAFPVRRRPMAARLTRPTNNAAPTSSLRVWAWLSRSETHPVNTQVIASVRFITVPSPLTVPSVRSLDDTLLRVVRHREPPRARPTRQNWGRPRIAAACLAEESSYRVRLPSHPGALGARRIWQRARPSPPYAETRRRDARGGDRFARIRNDRSANRT